MAVTKIDVRHLSIPRPRALTPRELALARAIAAALAAKRDGRKA